jgi:hypothetical protein
LPAVFVASKAAISSIQEINMPVVESFTLDHTKVKAPYVRVAGYERHRLGSVVQKFDLRFLQPNVDAIPTRRCTPWSTCWRLACVKSWKGLSIFRRWAAVPVSI